LPKCIKENMSAKEIEKILENSTNSNQLRLTIEDLIETKDYSQMMISSLVKILQHNDIGLQDIASRALIQTPPEFADECAKLTAQLIASSNIQIRNLAGDILIKLKSYSVPHLITFLDDVDFDVRKFACDIIGLIATTDVIKSIIPLLNDKDDNVVSSAVEAIGNIVSNNSEKKFFVDLELIKGLDKTYHSKEDLKPMIIETFGKIGGNSAQEFLFDKMLKEEDPFLQIACIDALAFKTENIEIAYRLLSLLSHHNLELQLIILKTIYAIAFRLEKSIVLPDELRYIAHNALNDEDEDIRAAGLIALGDIFYSQDVSFLIKEFKNNNVETQQHILYILLSNSQFDVIQEFFNNCCADLTSPISTTSESDILGMIEYVWRYVDPSNAPKIIDMLVDAVFHKQIPDSLNILEIIREFGGDFLYERLKHHLYSENSATISLILEYIEVNSISYFKPELVKFAELYPEYNEEVENILKLL